MASTKESAREDRRAERLERLSKTVEEKPDVSSEAAVAATGDDKMQQFINALVEKMNADGHAGKPLFNKSLTKRRRGAQPKQREVMLAALTKANGLGHQFGNWYRERRAPRTDHIMQNLGVYTKCQGCGHTLIVRMRELQEGEVPKDECQDPIPSILGESLRGTCMRLRGSNEKLAKMEQVASPTPDQ